jgi:phenol 2-monooxygenase
MWPFMKRSPSSSTSTSSSPPVHPKVIKMAPGVTADSVPSTSNSFETQSSTGASAANGWATGYDTFLSDVLVVGAGPAGLMLA